jgi:tRNA threonylcarbamoyladenosine biosynthesis protein TsaB
VKLLAIETSTEACSIAVWVDGAVHARHALAPRRHAELALPWCDAMLAEAGIGKRALDAIAVGRGPGAFTGVRLAVALAQGMALALDRPVLPVSTLAALAAGAHRDGAQRDAASAPDATAILAAIDARMGEVYLGLFQVAADGGVVALHPEWMARPGEVVLPPAPAWLHGVGTGLAAAEGALVGRLGDRLRRVDATALPHAADVARLGALAWERGEAIAADRLEPAYLRDKVALTLDEQKQHQAAARVK